MGPICNRLRSYPEVKEIIWEIGDTTLNRYRGAARARFDVIYTQDDDCLSDMRPLIDNYDPLRITNVMTRQHLKAYPGEETLLGFGALFHGSLLSALDGWEEDALLRREADRVFATLNPHFSVIQEVEHLPWAFAENRWYRQPEHGPSHVAIKQRIEVFRDARKA